MEGREGARPESNRQRFSARRHCGEGQPVRLLEVREDGILQGAAGPCQGFTNR